VYPVSPVHAVRLGAATMPVPSSPMPWGSVQVACVNCPPASCTDGVHTLLVFTPSHASLEAGLPPPLHEAAVHARPVAMRGSLVSRLLTSRSQPSATMAAQVNELPYPPRMSSSSSMHSP
jgi:hypothetical protein